MTDEQEPTIDSTEDEKFVAGLSAMYKIYATGRTQKECAENMAEVDEFNLGFWVAETARFSEEDAWVHSDKIDFDRTEYDARVEQKQPAVFAEVLERSESADKIFQKLWSEEWPWALGCLYRRQRGHLPKEAKPLGHVTAIHDYCDSEGVQQVANVGTHLGWTLDSDAAAEAGEERGD